MTQCYLYLLVTQVALLFAVVECNPYVTGLDVLYEWSTPDYTWPSPAERHEAIRSQKYIPLNVLIWDTSVFYYHKKDQRSCAKAKTITFVTTPRAKQEGIPAVLSTVETKDGKLNPRLKPFPNWEYNRQGNCNGFTNVYRAEIDTFQRLWVLDTGTVGSPSAGAFKKVCTPKIHIFDNLESGGRLVGKYPVPDDVLECDSLFTTFVVDQVHEHGSPEHVFAYITDAYANGVIVFSLHNKTFTRVVHNSFYPDPDEGDFYVDGVEFQTMNGIIGHSLSPIKDGRRTFYYWPFSGLRQSSVDTAVIRDQKAFLANPRAHSESFITYPKKWFSQGAADCMNSDGIKFWSILRQNVVGCWNSVRDPSGQQLIVVSQNDTTMQYISGMQVYEYQLFAVSSRAQNYYFGTVPPHEINYRLLYACVPELTRGTACESAEEQYNSHYPSEEYSSHYRSERRYEDYDDY